MIETDTVDRTDGWLPVGELMADKPIWLQIHENHNQKSAMALKMKLQRYFMLLGTASY